MVKLQITLTDQEAGLLADKAANLGYDVTKYAKFVLAREAEEVLKIIPTFKANPKMKRLIKQAIFEDDSGKTKRWPLG